jgi:hypothetical protein
MMAANPEASMAPTPEQIVDAMGVIEQGGDPRRLAAVCRHRAASFDDAGRQRLLACAESLDFAAALMATLEASPATETAGAAG